MRSEPTAFLVAPLLAVVALLGVPSPAAAHWVRWCAQFEVQYGDSAIDEDYWTETLNDTAKPLYGAYQIIRNHDTNELISSGYLYDGLNGTAGCTIYLPMASGAYDFFVYSSASVQGNTINVGDTDGVTQIMATYGVTVSSSTTKTITFAPSPLYGETWRVFNVQEAAAWALYRNAAALSGKSFDIEVGNPTGCGDDEGSCNTGGIVYIDDSRTNRKFRVAHEIGHRLAVHRGIANANDYGYDGQGEDIEIPCGASGTPGGWSPTSLEWVGAAVAEGFADFNGADAWNDHDENDCWMDYLGIVIDCEGSQTYENAWVNGNTCRTPDDPESGADVDWVRILWDVHTNGAAPDPSFTYIAREWMDQAGSWQRDTAFTVLDNRAEALDGDLWSNWLGALSTHAPYYCDQVGACE